MIAILASIGAVLAYSVAVLILHEVALALNNYAGVPAWIEWLYDNMVSLYTGN